MTPTSGLKSANWSPGGGADAEEDQEENPQQEVCSGESQEKEGLCWRPGEQVRKDARTALKRISDQYMRTNSRKCIFLSRLTRIVCHGSKQQLKLEQVCSAKQTKKCIVCIPNILTQLQFKF